MAGERDDSADSQRPPASETPVVSVITATYNRAHTLERLYRSLLAQTFRQLEWIVVDDGSDDETEELVRTWSDEHALAIAYHRQENRGKHVAVNRGVVAARGELVTVVDSDDWLPEEALERLLHHWNQIPEPERVDFSAVVGLCAFEDGRIVGDRFPRDPLDCDFVEVTFLHRVGGDKHGVHRADVARAFPFPFEDLRGLVTEALVANRVALKYRARHVNEVVLYKEYQEGGLSDLALEHLIASAPATSRYHLELLALPHALPRSLRARSYANYVRFSLHAGIRGRDQLRGVRSKAAWFLLAPLGLLLYARDRRRYPAARFAGADTSTFG